MAQTDVHRKQCAPKMHHHQHPRQKKREKRRQNSALNILFCCQEQVFKNRYLCISSHFLVQVTVLQLLLYFHHSHWAIYITHTNLLAGRANCSIIICFTTVVLFSQCYNEDNIVIDRSLIVLDLFAN